jgi:gluconolactonase
MYIERFHPGLDLLIDVDAVVETLASGGDLGLAPEGQPDYGATLESPLWWEEPSGGFLLFSNIPQNCIMSWSADEGLSVFHQPSGHANGLWRDPQGRLLMCEHSGRQVSRREPDGSITVVMRSYRGQRLNRPNTVIVASDGGIYFTDYKFRTGLTEDWDVDFEGIFHVSADLGTKTLLVRDLYRPHKIILSADERVLFVGQAGGVLAYDVLDALSFEPGPPRRGGRLNRDSRRWVWRTSENGAPEADGIKLDEAGNFYIAVPYPPPAGQSGRGPHSGRPGLWFISADGELLGHLDTDGLGITNLAFGGVDRRTLFFVGSHALFSVPVLIPGLPILNGEPLGRRPSR